MRTFVYQWDLLSNLVQRDIKMHYRRSILGLLWAQLNPLASLIIFSFVFQRIVPLNIPNYPAYVFSGLLAWSWFSSCINTSNYSITSSRDLVRKPQFPTEMIIVVSVAANMINFVLALPVLLGLLLINHLIPNWTITLLPLVMLIQFVFTLGLSLILSCITVFFRDVLHITAIAINLWFYITPIFYSLGATDNKYSFIINWNPMTHLIAAYRRILLEGQVPDLTSLLWLSVCAGIVFVLGLSLFRRVKYNFVDEI